MIKFETPQPGITLDIDGLTEEEAAAAVLKAMETAPKHPSDLNLGCGPEPDVDNVAAAKLAAEVLLAVPVDQALGEQRIDLAKRTGAWFYWSYACALAEQELRQEMGDENFAAMMASRPRPQYNKRREEKLVWVFQEHFGEDLETPDNS